MIPKIFVFGYSGIRIPEYPNTRMLQILGIRGIRVFGYSGIRVFEYPNTRIPRIPRIPVAHGSGLLPGRGCSRLRVQGPRGQGLRTQGFRAHGARTHGLGAQGFMAQSLRAQGLMAQWLRAQCSGAQCSGLLLHGGGVLKAQGSWREGADGLRRPTGSGRQAQGSGLSGQAAQRLMLGGY
jgi:hypothetical protein